MVTGGAGVVIVTGGLVGAVQANAPWATTVVGAGVTIIAMGGGTANANAFKTAIIDGASVTVITGDTIGAWCKPARAGIRTASDHEARGIGSCGLGAGNDGLDINHAKVGQFLGIADEGAITDVPVLKGLAITVLQTFAVHGISGARHVLALVGHGAGVTIVALSRVGDKEAAPGFVAGVVGAGVIVIAIHG
jgi:hypothetical protein